MRDPRALYAGLSVGVTLLVAAGAQPLTSRSRVEQASTIVVATLVSSEELTANGVDYGHGILRIESVLHPKELGADRLLLRWSNSTIWTKSRLDPRSWEGQPSLWFLTLEDDGAVRLVDREGAVPLSQVDRIEQVLSDLWPLSGGTYDERVLALEAFVAGQPFPQPGNRPRPPGPVVSQKMDFALRDYDTYPQFKAFAIAIDPAGRWVYGYTNELPTEELAAERALLECSIRAARTRVNAPCQLYKLGDTTMWGEE
ncbi:MAG: hypothetical protein ACREAA_15180 [Candidatus Polarisedimenticolia bacterium]